VTLSFTIPGAPRTKKTHSRIVQAGGRPRILPSKQYLQWDRDARVHLLMTWREPVIHAEVNCKALFYRDALTGDATGYYQALADTLEKAGVIHNDRLIVSWDGSRLMKDAVNPRVEVTIETL
jgi:Holliday junction resolvase RusA-like endonuclease